VRVYCPSPYVLSPGVVGHAGVGPAAWVSVPLHDCQSLLKSANSLSSERRKKHPEVPDARAP